MIVIAASHLTVLGMAQTRRHLGGRGGGILLWTGVNLLLLELMRLVEHLLVASYLVRRLNVSRTVVEV